MKTTFRIAFICIALTLSAADWPQLLGPDRNATSKETGLIDSFGNKGPKVIWEREVGEGYASPVVAGGSLYLYHRVGDDDTLEKLDAKTGKLQWKYTYRTDYKDALAKGDGPRSTPLVSGGKVYTLGAAGQLHCVDVKSGKKVWSKDLVKTYDVPASYFGVGSTPIVEGDLLLINVGGEKAGIVAFNKDSGKEMWKATEDPASYSSPIAATVGKDRHVIFFTRTGLVSLDPKTGKVRATKRWRAGIDASVNAAMPVLLGGNHVLLTSSYRTGAIVLKLKADGVDEVWKNDTSLSSQFSSPVAVGDQVYGFHGRQDIPPAASLRCIDWKTGKVRWSEKDFGCGSVIAADKKLFIMSEFGELVIAEINAEKYVEKARAKVLGKPCRAHMALADGRLYARDPSKLVCWQVKKD